MVQLGQFEIGGADLFLWKKFNRISVHECLVDAVVIEKMGLPKSKIEINVFNASTQQF